MSHGVLCAVRGPIETAVVRAVGTVSDRLEVARRCADLAELLACAAAGLGRVAVVSADLPGLDREAVHHLHGSDVWVVVLGGSDHPGPADRLRLLGVDAVLGPAEAEQRVVEVVLGLLDRGTGGTSPGQQPGQRADPGSSRPAAGPEPALTGLAVRALDEVLDDEAVRAPGATDPLPGVAVRTAPAQPSPAPRGTVVAVWGPTGAPGRTTIALNLAAELAQPETTRPATASGRSRGRPHPWGRLRRGTGSGDGPGDAALAQRAGHGALLVDADTYGGTVAQMIGLLDEAPGVAAAARSAADGRLDAVSLAALTPVLDGGLRVLTGISRADRWPEVPASSLEVVWSAARRLAAWTVIDCGFGVEQDEALSYDTRAPQRNAATLSALAEADVVVVVGSGDPIGLQRLVRALDELTDLGGPVPARQVVVNRVRASASGPRPGEAITDALHRYAGVPHVHLVPEDRAACDGAVLAAQTLREYAPGSPARRAVAALAATLVAAARPVGAH